MKIAEGHLVVSYVLKREAKVKSVTLFICFIEGFSFSKFIFSIHSFWRIEFITIKG